MTRHELADAMIRGKNTPNVLENDGYYLEVMSNVCWACALGCALIGHHDGDFDKAEMELEKAGGFDWDCDEAAIFAELLEIPRPLAITVELNHLNGMSIQQIAVWLKTSEQEVKANV